MYDIPFDLPDPTFTKKQTSNEELQTRIKELEKENAALRKHLKMMGVEPILE